MKNSSFAQWLRQKGWNGDWLALRAPDEASAILDDERQVPKGEEQTVERITITVQRPDQHALDRKPDDGRQWRCQSSNAPQNPT